MKYKEVNKTLDNHDSTAHLALASIVAIWSDPVSISIGDGVGGLEGQRMGAKVLFERLSNFDRGIALRLSFALDDDDS